MKLTGVTQLLRLSVTDSTQTVARFLAEQGAPHGTLVWAGRQTKGRGRMSRKWDSPPGGLYVSLVLRPSFAPGRLADFSVRTAGAVARALSSHAAIRTAVKLPNDVIGFKGDIPKKICGILAEASGNGRHLDWLVVGIGVNVNNAPRARGASSLMSLTGRTWEIPGVLRSVLRACLASWRGR